MASVERLADRVLLHAVRSTAGWRAAPRTEVPTPAPQQIAVQQSGVDRLISRVLAHASHASHASSEAAPIQEAAELGNSGGQSASLLSSPFLSSLDISGVAGGEVSAVSPIAFRPELNSSQETIAERVALKDMETQSEGHIAAMGCLRDARFVNGADNDASTLSFLQSDESKEQEETRLPEEVKFSEQSLGRPQATVPSADQSYHARQLQEMQVTVMELKKQLAEESHEKESLNGALAEALAALAESERATASAQKQLREAHTRGGTMEISEIEQEVDTTLQVSQSEISLGAGQGLPSVSGQTEDFRQHAGIQDAAGGNPSQLQDLESRLEDTQRQLEACLQAAAAPLEDRSNAGIGGGPSFSTEEVSMNPLDDKLMACLDLRHSLGDLLDPPELLLKAAMGQLYAVLCLQTKAKSFLATKQLIGLRKARPYGRSNRPSSAMYQASRPPAHRQSLPQVFPHGLQVPTFHELDDEASTERRRWSDAPPVPPLPLGDLGQLNRRPSTACSEAVNPEAEVGAVACGSGISAVRAGSAVKGKGCRPSSSPGLFTQKRSDPPAAKPLRRAMSAGGAAAAQTRATSACRSRPQSHSRKGHSGNPEGFVPQAELWLIKNRALASMMWPPLSEAARGRRPKTKTACVRCLPDPTPQPQGF